jgi:UTP--glucose-1-phosphate uridylyltransferase
LEAGKEKQAEEVRNIANLANFIYVRQKGPYGNGTPVLNARHVIGNEPFAILWGDEFVYSDPPRLKQMMDVWETTGVPNISGVRVPKTAVDKYGIADISPIRDNIFRINRIVEKPKPEDAPSDLMTGGAYIMPPRLFDILAETPTGKGGELWLVDAIEALAKEQEIHAVEIKNGRYYDTGNKLEYLKTVVEFGLRHPDLKDDFAAFLKRLP